jgi:4-carboxymuconolactone decarboxylase
VPRVDPLPEQEWTDDTRAALSRILPPERHREDEIGSVLATLIRHPRLARTFFSFNVQLTLKSTLPARLQELAVLRVAQLRHCGYEVHHHSEMAAKHGLTAAQIEAALRGDTTAEFTAVERLVLVAVDELETDHTLSDPTWSALAEHLDEPQRIDLVFTIGAYAMLALAINAFGIELEPERR